MGILRWDDTLKALHDLAYFLLRKKHCLIQERKWSDHWGMYLLNISFNKLFILDLVIVIN